MTQTVDLHNPRFIRERGLEVLTKELGCVETVYFLRQFSAGKGNWTAERKTELAGLTTADIEHDIESLRNAKPPVFSHRNVKTVQGG